MCKIFFTLSRDTDIKTLNQLTWFNPLFLISIKEEDKIDIYDFGVILLELIVGRPLRAKGQVDVLKEQVTTPFDITRNKIEIFYFNNCFFFFLFGSYKRVFQRMMEREGAWWIQQSIEHVQINH